MELSLSGLASQSLIALYCTTASQTVVCTRTKLVKKQISGPHPLIQSLGGTWKPEFYQVMLVSQGPCCGNHAHCFSHCIRYQCLESQTSMSSVSGLPTHFREAPRILEWVAISFSRGSSCPGIEPESPALAGRFFTIWATKEAHLLWTELMKCKTKPSSIQDGRTSPIPSSFHGLSLPWARLLQWAWATGSGLHLTTQSPITGTHCYTKTKLN